MIPQEIETEISLLPYNKALGLYSTPVELLKLAKSVKSIPLTEISKLGFTLQNVNMQK